MLPRVKCNHCKHEWIPRVVNPQTGLPYQCPKCNNPRKMEWKK